MCLNEFYTGVVLGFQSAAMTMKLVCRFSLGRFTFSDVSLDMLFQTWKADYAFH